MTQETLPGLEMIVRDSEGYEDLSRDTKVTAERLLACHPDRYQIAARLYFEFGASKRSVCDICKIGIHTLNALVEREVLTRGGEILAKRGKAKKSMIKLNIIEDIEETIESGALGDFDLKDKVSLLERFERLTKSPEDGEKTKNANGNGSGEGETIDADYEEIMG